MVLISQVDLAMEVQEALPIFIWRRSIIKKRTVYPNREAGSAISRAYYSFTGQEQLAAQAISTALNPPKVIQQAYQLPLSLDNVMKTLCFIYTFFVSKV